MRFTPEQVIALVVNFPRCARFTNELINQAARALVAGQAIEFDVEMNEADAAHMREHLQELAASEFVTLVAIGAPDDREVSGGAVYIVVG